MASPYQFCSSLDELEIGDKLRILIYGPPKIGKTFALLTWPRPLVLINTDPGGMNTLKGENTKGIYVADLSTEDWVVSAKYIDFLVAAFNRSAAALKVQPYVPGFEDVLKVADVKTIGLDSFTGMSRIAMARAKLVGKRGGKSIPVGTMGEPDRSHYHLESVAAVTAVTELVSLDNVHFVMTAHERVAMNDDGDIPVAGNIFARGTATQEIPSMFDEFWHMEMHPSVKDGKRIDTRMFRTQPDNVWNAGTRLHGLDQFEIADFEAIVAKAKEYEMKRKEAMQ